MSASSRARRPAGLLLSSGAPGTVSSWAARGLVPVQVVEQDDWTAVVPAGPSAAGPPYDEALRVLAARPVASRMRPTFGLFVIDDIAVVTVHPAGWRAVQRWVLWHPAHGLARSQGLALARPSGLAKAAGVPGRATERDVSGVLRGRHLDALTLLEGLVQALDLPGFPLLAGAPPDPRAATLVEPQDKHVARFEATVHHEARMRAELEEP